MLVRRGMGVIGAGIVPSPTTEQSVQYEGGALPWQCGWIPFYAQINPKMCTPLPSTLAPVAPVIPAGSLDVPQNPAGPGSGGSYSVDQVIFDTAAAQRQQTQGFFTDLANSLGLTNPAVACDPSSFWCKYGLWVLIAGALGFAWVAGNRVMRGAR